MATDPHPDSIPEDDDANPDIPPDMQDDDARSDIEQAVEARADAVARGEGGEPETLTASGDYSGNAGTGGEVKNQDVDAQ